MILTLMDFTLSSAHDSTLAGTAASLSMLVLLALLAVKELTSTTTGMRYRTLSRVLNIGILPLLLVFILLVCSRLAETMR